MSDRRTSSPESPKQKIKGLFKKKSKETPPSSPQPAAPLPETDFEDWEPSREEAWHEHFSVSGERARSASPKSVPTTIIHRNERGYFPPVPGQPYGFQAPGSIAEVLAGRPAASPYSEDVETTQGLAVPEWRPLSMVAEEGTPRQSTESENWVRMIEAADSAYDDKREEKEMAEVSHRSLGLATAFSTPQNRSTETIIPARSRGKQPASGYSTPASVSHESLIAGTASARSGASRTAGIARGAVSQQQTAVVPGSAASILRPKSLHPGERAEQDRTTGSDLSSRGAAVQGAKAAFSKQKSAKVPLSPPLAPPPSKPLPEKPAVATSSLFKDEDPYGPDSLFKKPAEFEDEDLYTSSRHNSVEESSLSSRPKDEKAKYKHRGTSTSASTEEKDRKLHSKKSHRTGHSQDSSSSSYKTAPVSKASSTKSTPAEIKKVMAESVKTAHEKAKALSTTSGSKRKGEM